MQPGVWTLIETEAGDPPMSAPQPSRILNPPLLLMITPSKVQHSANEHQETCTFKLAQCLHPQVDSHSCEAQNLEDTVWP